MRCRLLARFAQMDSRFALRESAIECAFMLAPNHPLLRTACLLSIALWCWAPNMQAPAVPSAVPLTAEPRHHLVFENSYVRAFRVSIPGHDATLLHQHDVPYVYVALGPAEFVNAVAGKPEVHVVMTDGQIGYSRGGFAHIARTDAGSAFNNVTIELLKPQGEPQNVCAKIVPDAADAPCPDTPADPKDQILGSPLFRTDEMNVQLGSHGPDGEVVIVPGWGSLLVIVSGDGIQKMEKDKSAETLSAGSVVWLPALSNTTFNNVSGKPWTTLTLSFKDASAFRNN